MAVRVKSCSILGSFCFRVGSVIALAGARDLLAIGTKPGSFSKVFLGGEVRTAIPLTERVGCFSKIVVCSS
jgi:hypothetical protein